MRSVFVAGLLMVGAIAPEVAALPRIIVTSQTFQVSHTASFSHTFSTQAAAATVTKVGSSFEFEEPSKLDINPHNKGLNKGKLHANPAVNGKLGARMAIAEAAAPVLPALDSNGDIIVASDTLNSTGNTKVVDSQSSTSSTSHGASSTISTDLTGTGMKIVKKILQKILQKIKALLGHVHHPHMSENAEDGADSDSDGDDDDDGEEPSVGEIEELYDEAEKELDSMGINDR